MKRSDIGIAESTWNPVRGCSAVSPGCANCWAERIAGRYAKKGQTYYGIAMLVNGQPTWTEKTQLADDQKYYEPLSWSGRVVQVGTMTDLFYDKISDAVRDHIFGVMAICPDHQFQILTKRPQAMQQYFAAPDVWERIELQARAIWLEQKGHKYPSKAHLKGPLRHTWLGVSVENQEMADRRIPILQSIPAALRYVAAEPLLEAITLTKYLDGKQKLDWVIAGGESGMEARPCNPVWVRKIRDACLSLKTPFFFHQWGAWLPINASEELKNHADNPNSSIWIWPDGGTSVNLARSDVNSMKKWGTLLDGQKWTEMPKL